MISYCTCADIYGYGHSFYVDVGSGLNGKMFKKRKYNNIIHVSFDLEFIAKFAGAQKKGNLH